MVRLMRENLLQAFEEPRRLSFIIRDQQPGTFPHTAYLHEDLQVKLLHAAALTGDVLTIERLANLVDTNDRTAGNFTALHLAASRGHVGVLRLLLEWPNVDVAGRSLEGFTALHLAAYGGHEGCVEALLKKCPNYDHVNARDYVMERSALHWAVGVTSSRKIFDLLLEIPEIEICPKDRAGFMPTHYATMNVATILDEQMVYTLLRRYPTGVNDKVGDVGRFLDCLDVDQFNSRSWRTLSGIEMVHPGGQRGRSGTQFKTLHKFMSGYTLLHFAACQNNAEIVSYLLVFPAIKPNEPDMEHGMTPLHCSLLCGAMKAFLRLMSFVGVDVNAQLSLGGPSHHMGVLNRPPQDIFQIESSDGYDFQCFQNFQSLETPLHLGLRFCPERDILQMMIKFYNHPKFNPATCNDEGFLPLQVAWARSYLENNSSSKLQEALDIFEGHPSHSFLMSSVRDEEQAFQITMNAVMVSATLLAGVTFGSIEPPIRADDRDGSSVSIKAKGIVRNFCAFASVSFYLAIATVCLSLASLWLRPAAKSHRLPNHYQLRQGLERVTVLMLLFSIVYGAIAFDLSSLNNLPPYARVFLTLGTFFGAIVLYFTGSVTYEASSKLKESANYRKTSPVYRYSSTFLGNRLRSKPTYVKRFLWLWLYTCFLTIHVPLLSTTPIREFKKVFTLKGLFSTDYYNW